MSELGRPLTPREIATEAIEMFIEYRDKHGYNEDAAKAFAVLEVVEGCGWEDEATHVIEFREDGWTIKHPLACRPNLFDCPVNRAAERDLIERPDSLGRFQCDVDSDGRLVVSVPSSPNPEADPS